MPFQPSVVSDRCINSDGCEVCVVICPVEVFEIQNFISVPVNDDECIGCCLCQRGCPTAAITVQSIGGGYEEEYGLPCNQTVYKASPTLILSNHWKYQLAKKNVDVSADTFKAILMGATWPGFNKDTHSTYADVSSYELATGNGYTAGGSALSGGTLTEDDTDDKATRAFSNLTWTATANSIGPTKAMIIYDDTTSDNTIVGCVDFGTEYTFTSGMKFTLESPKIELS